MKLKLSAEELPAGRKFTVLGRDAWALLELMKAGRSGCTPIDHPGPRWSAYVHALRTECGLLIETRSENHGGPFAGRHARYILHSQVRVLSRSDRASVEAGLG